MSRFTDTVKLFLHKNNITQVQLAEKIGTSKQLLNRYLNNEYDSINMELKCKEFINEWKKN